MKRATMQASGAGLRRYGLMALASGAAALIYQLLWLRGFSLAFGSTTQAAGLTLAVFMLGLALGGAWVKRWKRTAALKDYALLELGIAGSAALSLILLRSLPQASALLFHKLNPAPWAELLLTSLLAAIYTVPTAVLAGATLPVLVQVLHSQGQTSDQGFSKLYRLNTLGAAAGVLLASFVLIPTHGLNSALAAAIALNLSVAAIAWASRHRVTVIPAPVTSAQPALAFDIRLAWAALALGLSAFILEIAWMRSFALAVGSSVYAFELMLAALLLGTALGTALYERHSRQASASSAQLIKLLGSLAILILGQAWLCGQLGAAYFHGMRLIEVGFFNYQWLAFGLAFFTLLPVTLMQGYLFPLLLQLDRSSASQPQAAAGRLYAWNTAGALLGALGCAYLLLPLAGIQPAFSWAALPPMLAAASLLAMPRALRLGVGLAALALAGAGARYYRPWDPLSVTSGAYLYGMTDRPAILNESSHRRWAQRGNTLLSYKEGAETTVSVRDTGSGPNLQVNGKTDASSGDAGAFKLVAHYALGLQARPGRVLAIGWGSGCTLGSASLYDPDAIDCVEIEPAVFETAHFFGPLNRGVDKDPRFKMHFADGRKHLLRSQDAYDLIVSNPSNPWIKGVGNLFTREFYELASRRLSPQGVFSQWFHFYHMREDDLKMFMRTFTSVFPYASLWLVPSADERPVIVGDLIVLGSTFPLEPDPARLRALLARPALTQDLREVGLHSPLTFALNRLMGKAEMLAYAGPGPLNRDSDPRLEFSAPRALYETREETDLNNLRTFAALEAASTLPGQWQAYDAGPGHSQASAAEQLRLTAELCAIKNRYHHAALLLRDAAERWPGDHRFDYACALLALYQRNTEQAESFLQSHLKLEPANRRTLIRLAKLYLGLRQPDKSLPLYQSLAKRDPRDAEAYLGQGLSLSSLGRLDEAMQALRRCLEIEPGNSIASGMLGRISAARAGR